MTVDDHASIRTRLGDPRPLAGAHQVRARQAHSERTVSNDQPSCPGSAFASRHLDPFNVCPSKPIKPPDPCRLSRSCLSLGSRASARRRPGSVQEESGPRRGGVLDRFRPTPYTRATRERHGLLLRITPPRRPSPDRMDARPAAWQTRWSAPCGPAPRSPSCTGPSVPGTHDQRTPAARGNTG